MQIAILLFDQVTALDAIGPYEVLNELPGAEVIFTGIRTGPARAENGRLGLMVDATLAEIPQPDLIVVPGGSGVDAHLASGPVIDWLRRADTASTWMTSVCTGSPILAASGLLRGRHATSHWLALAELARYGAEPVSERVVFDGKYVTAAGCRPAAAWR